METKDTCNKIINPGFLSFVKGIIILCDIADAAHVLSDLEIDFLILGGPSSSCNHTAFSY